MVIDISPSKDITIKRMVLHYKLFLYLAKLATWSSQYFFKS